MTTNVAYKEWLAEADESIIFLDKADGGKVTMDDVQEGLQEYKRLFKAGLASPAEILTLHRAYPDVPKYANVVEILDLSGDSEPTVIGGPASVELVDREGHLITSDALEDAFRRYMDNFRTRNVMVMHSDVQVGHALPVYISRGMQIFKSGVEGDNLFFISELRDDTKIANKVKEQITSGKMRSYSIAGSATKTKNISKGADSYMQVDALELAEITICEKGVNQGAHFEIMKAEQVVPTEHESDLYVISKEDIPSFTEVFSTWFGKASKEGIVPELTGKQMAVLENGTARQIQHRALLDEMGFPMYVYPENLRYPVDYDEPGRPVPSKIVNQAGQDLGDSNVEEMVKSATDTFINILRKDSKTTTKTTYDGRLPDYAVPSDVRHKVKSDPPTPIDKDDDVYSRAAKVEQIRETKKPSLYRGTVTTETSSTPKVTSQTTGAVPTNSPGSSLKTNITTKSKAMEKLNEATPVHEPNINPSEKSLAGVAGKAAAGVVGEAVGEKVKDKLNLTEKGLIGDVVGGAVKVAGAGVKGLAGAATGAAAGLTGSKQTVDWSGEKSTEKGFFRETAPRTTDTTNPFPYKGPGKVEKKLDPIGVSRSKNRPSYGNIGEHSFLQTSDDDDNKEEALKKSTDIFKRVLEAERPDETWTGTDKEVPMEKIIGLLAAPIAGAIGSAVGAGLSTVGGIAGGAAKKLIGG